MTTPEQYAKDLDRAATPTDEEMLQDLDAYGHLTWCVGFGEEGAEAGDWLACFDFEVYPHPERGLLVAYEVVVNSESGGFVDTLERRVVPAKDAPFNLPDYWRGVGSSTMLETETEAEANRRTNERWNEELRRALAREEP